MIDISYVFNPDHFSEDFTPNGFFEIPAIMGLKCAHCDSMSINLKALKEHYGRKEHPKPVESTPCRFIYIPGNIGSLTQRQYLLPAIQGEEEKSPSSSPPLKRARLSLRQSIVGLTTDAPPVANDLDKSRYYSKTGLSVLLSQSGSLGALSHLANLGYETVFDDDSAFPAVKYPFIDKSVLESLFRIVDGVLEVIRNECEAADSDLKARLCNSGKVRYFPDLFIHSLLHLYLPLAYLFPS